MHFAFINTETMEYPLHEGDIRLVCPEIGEELTGDTFPVVAPFASVEWVAPPNEFDPELEIPEQLIPELIDGVWKAKWHIRLLTDQEKEERSKLQAEIEAALAEQETPASE